MKLLFAAIVTALFATAGFAQSAPQTADKAQAKKAVPAKPVPAKTASAKKVAAPTKRQVIEELTPTSDPDPSIKLSEAQLAIAKTVYTGEISCELGEKVSIKPMRREGFFFVSRGINRFVMHPVESRTGALRLEDPARGALWLQLANKSMLMSQKEGKRLADECQSPDQVAFAKNMKAVNLLEPGK